MADTQTGTTCGPKKDCIAELWPVLVAVIRGARFSLPRRSWLYMSFFGWLEDRNAAGGTLLPYTNGLAVHPQPCP